MQILIKIFGNYWAKSGIQVLNLHASVVFKIASPIQKEHLGPHCLRSYPFLALVGVLEIHISYWKYCTHKIASIKRHLYIGLSKSSAKWL